MLNFQEQLSQYHFALKQAGYTIKEAPTLSCVYDEKGICVGSYFSFSSWDEYEVLQDICRDIWEQQAKADTEQRTRKQKTHPPITDVYR